MSFRHTRWMPKFEGGVTMQKKGGGGSGVSFRTAEESRGRWEEEGGRGGPNMTCVSAF